jgi:hypothetical protein
MSTAPRPREETGARVTDTDGSPEEIVVIPFQRDSAAPRSLDADGNPYEPQCLTNVILHPPFRSSRLVARASPISPHG